MSFLDSITSLVGSSGPATGTSNIAGEWKTLADGYFKGIQFHVAVPTRGNQPTKGNKSSLVGIMREESSLQARNQVIKRPGVAGADIVVMGLDPEEFTAEIIFFGNNWQDQYELFKTALVDPNPGNLTLPTQRATVKATFGRMTALAQVGDGNAKTATVTWILAESTDQSTGPTGGLTPELGTGIPASGLLGALASAQAAVGSAINGANGVIAGSGILQAVNGVEAGLSAVKRYTNIVNAIASGITNRIKQIQANFVSTFAQIENMVNVVAGDLGLNNTPTAAAAGAATQASNASSATGAVETPTVDPDTGQLIVPNNQAPITPPANPLVAPPLASNTGVTVGDLTTDNAIQNAANAMIAVLQSQSAELNGYLGGMTSDVSDAMTPIVTALQNFVYAATFSASTTILTTTELSLGEIMFYNGIGLEQLRAIHQQNPQILDPAVVPSGTVVYL